MKLQLAFWRSLFALTVHASSAVARIVRATESRFYDACLRDALTRPATDAEREAQRRSFAYGQVAMHDPSITRERVDAIADTMPAPSAGWACLAGDLDGHDAGEVDERDLHDAEDWRLGSGQRNGWEA